MFVINDCKRDSNSFEIEPNSKLHFSVQVTKELNYLVDKNRKVSIFDIDLPTIVKNYVFI
jgi:hypothetical protein